GNIETIKHKLTVLKNHCSNIGRNYRSDGDRIINVNATLEYTKRSIATNQ
ncbi:hypothetical protein LCGC14_2709650, partial [marine sediment metagenome]